tara:strand:- start:466 stop:1071 length:606 start_codon:yes stop_codon:yes gene_type:complete
MKKIFIMLLIVVLVPTISSAQTQYGAVVGLNFANVSGDDIEDSKMRLGIRLGASFSRELSDAVMLNTGLLYSVKGFSYEIDVVNLSTLATEKVDANMSFNYLEIPVNFAFSVADQFSLMAGFYSAFLVGVTHTIDGEDMDADTDDFSSIDFGIGLGADFSITDAISLNAGYQIGLAELDEDGDVDAKNANILFGMTYHFDN